MSSSSPPPPSSAAMSADIAAVSSMRASLKDRMKKRKERMQGLMQGAANIIAVAKTTTPKKDATAPVVVTPSPPPKKKVKEELELEPTKETTPLSEAEESPVAPAREKKRQSQDSTGSDSRKKDGGGDNDILSLLSTQSAKEKEEKKQREEIHELLSQPTAKERSLLDTFRSASGSGVKEFCSHSTKGECMKVRASRSPCDKLHFAKILQPHTDESLGDCSFLNTCFHMDTCKYIHYEVDAEDMRTHAQRVRLSENNGGAAGNGERSSRHLLETHKLVPPQWVQCDLRSLDLAVLGKFSVVMADPPWDIHMELPYGTMSDDEMRHLPVPSLQDEGLIFLWVTGRAMELGRECLKLWGYERVDEIIWVKTNQLQRIIRTGRTGHWLNHGKEHCIVGMKGDIKLNRGLDCDVIVAEVRATSHKPDEIYGIIERLSPGTRKIELFGRPHNVQPNWVTLGNQLDGIVIHDEEMLRRWHESYPNGYDLVKGMTLHPRKEP